MSIKVFEIGLMKTGSSSLGKAYEILGYKHKGWKKIPGGDNNTSIGILVPITALIGIR